MFTVPYDLSHLTDLVILLERPDIQTAEALLSKAVGDRVAGKMLTRLLYWFPKSVKGGWVYKSWRDWLAEVDLSPAQIKRVHQRALLEQVGISRELHKANGAPTTHYTLDFDALLNRLAEFLNHSVKDLTEMLSGNQPVAKPSKPSQSRSKNTQKTAQKSEMALLIESLPAEEQHYEPEDLEVEKMSLLAELKAQTSIPTLKRLLSDAFHFLGGELDSYPEEVIRKFFSYCTDDGRRNEKLDTVRANIAQYDTFGGIRKQVLELMQNPGYTTQGVRIAFQTLIFSKPSLEFFSKQRNN